MNQIKKHKSLKSKKYKKLSTSQTTPPSDSVAGTWVSIVEPNRARAVRPPSPTCPRRRRSAAGAGTDRCRRRGPTTRDAATGRCSTRRAISAATGSSGTGPPRWENIFEYLVNFVYMLWFTKKKNLGEKIKVWVNFV